jgi:UDP-glucose:(glucosyl)LPS alpha-1,2-glucosyltransferase
VAASLKSNPPALIEVHNRPEIALILSARLPRIPVVAFLHNDPHGMRQAVTPTDRTRMLQRLAGVITPSAYLRQRAGGPNRSAWWRWKPWPAAPP